MSERDVEAPDSTNQLQRDARTDRSQRNDGRFDTRSLDDASEAPAERAGRQVKPTDAIDADAGFLPDDRMEDLRARWSALQANFVDDPRAAVQDAHLLVKRTVEELTQTFSREREQLEKQWNSGDVDTENLRVALQRYRSFFNRLLAT